MTYQKPTQHYDNNADEPSSLFLTAADASPSFSLGQVGVATTKKNGVPMRVMIATTCFFLGTLAVIHYGRSNINTHRTESTSEALLLGHTQVGPAFDPCYDHCFKATQVEFDQYCWYPTQIAMFPSGNWKKAEGAGYDDCGPECTVQVYDPSQDYCFTDEDNVDKYCWYPTNHYPYGNWKGVTGAGYDNCGLPCTRLTFNDAN